MVLKKEATIIIVLLVLTVSAAALSFNVQVKEQTQFNEYQVKYSNTSSLYQRVDLVSENPGSLGCNYRMKTRIHYGDKTVTRFSKAYPMWPGDTADATIKFLPYNYNGTVNVSLSSFFCDRQQHITNFTYQHTEVVNTTEKIESRTTHVEDDRAKIYTPETGKALLIPIETPAYWKTGSTEVRGKYASIEYEPPLFKEGEEIKYLAVRNGTVLGKTTVVLEDEETRIQEYRRKLGDFFSNII